MTELVSLLLVLWSGVIFESASVLAKQVQSLRSWQVRSILVQVICSILQRQLSYSGEIANPQSVDVCSS